MYQFENYDELVNKYAGPNTDYKTLCVMITSAGGELRTKIRNTAYETVRQLRGNQPKLQYSYLVLRKERKVGEYLKYYPEHKAMFSKYRQDIHLFTDRLHSNYVSCYVRKEKPLREYPDEFRTNMFNLHKIFKTELIQNGRIVNKSIVIRYVNALEPSILMHVLNFRANHSRKNTTYKNQEQDNSQEQDTNNVETA